MSYEADVERAITAAADLCGDRPRAIFWFYNQALDVFDGLTADAVVQAGKVESLVEYIESLESGFTG